MDSSLWPAAVFGFVFVLLGVVRLAKTPLELGWGIGLAGLMALCIVFVSPVALVPVGLTVVAMGWWRNSSDLSKKRPPSPIQHIWNPNPTNAPTNLVLSSLVDGLVIGAAQAQERGLVPWKPPAGTAQEQAVSLAVRAQRTNPFRPEGALGHRTGLVYERQTVMDAGDVLDQGSAQPEPTGPDQQAATGGGAQDNAFLQGGG